MKYLCLFIVFLSITTLHFNADAQSDLDSDELFKLARTAAFDQKDYPKAINLCNEALAKSPGYEDIRVFLGRIYTWNDLPDKAREQLGLVLQKNPKSKDALLASLDLEFWNNNSEKALEYCNAALTYYPNDEEFLLKKARILNDLKRYTETFSVLGNLLDRYPQNSDARSLMDRVKENSSQNKITLSYDYLYFDQNYNSALHNSPWNIASLSYSTRTGIGSVIGRVSYANRFSSNGLQAEIDAYPRISNVFYSYLNVGYSDDLPVFPKFRAGMSLYANLPKSFEGEVGFRYLKFSSETWIYTASLGKYIGNYWFNLRTFLVPGNTNLSQSYTLTTRYYYGEADDYISVGIGTGISPDESRSVLIERQLKLNSKKVNLGLSKIFNKRNVFIITASWFNEEQHNSPNGNQFDVGLSYQRRF